MARRQINKNVIVALTLFGLTMVVVVAALMLQQVRQRDPAYFVQLADESEAAGNLESAIAAYGKAWDRSKDAAYLVEIGRLYVALGDLGMAVRSWQEALINQPDLAEAHRKMVDLRLELARLYNRTDDWKAVRDGAEALLGLPEALGALDEARTRNALGLAQIRLANLGEGSVEKGEDQLAQAARLDPDAVQYALDLASRYIATDRMAEAKRLLEKAVSDHADPGLAAVKAGTALAKLLASQDLDEQAVALFERCLTLARGVPEARTLASLAYASHLAGRWASSRDDEALFDRAEALLNAAIEDAPEEYAPYLQLGTLYGAAGRHADVLKVCEQRLNQGLDRTGVRGARNRLDAFSLMIFAAEACILESTRQYEAGDETARQEWLARAEGFIDDAGAELPANPRTSAQRARLRIAQGLERQALEELRIAQEGYEAAGTIHWENTIVLAGLHLKLGEPGAARAALERVMELARRDRANDPRFWTLYARALFQGNETDRALALVNQVLQTSPDYSEAKALQFTIYEKQGRRDEALRIAEAMTDDPVQVVLVKARGLLLEDDLAGALDVVKKGLSEAPADEQLVSAAVRILLKMDRAGEARAIVESALRVRPDDTRLQLHLALTRDDLSPAQRDAAILNYIEQEEDAYQRALERIGFLMGKSDLESLLTVLDEAIGYLTTGSTPTAQRAAGGQLRILLETKLSVAGSLGREQAMFAARDLAAKENVDGANGKFFEGLVHMHLEDYQAAVSSFRAASALQPTDARLLARLGQCYQILDRLDEAEAFYQQAIQANPQQRLAHKGLAMIAKRRGDETAYDHHFRIADPQLPEDAWMRAERLEREEKSHPHEAIARRRERQLEKPDDVDNLTRLAALYESVDDPKRAAATYTSALSAAPDNKPLVGAAARFFGRTGDLAAVESVVTRYIAAQTEPAERARGHLLLASHLQQFGAIERAEAALLAALEAFESLEVIESLAEFHLVSTGQPDKAMPWLDRAVALAQSTQSVRLPRIMALRVTSLLQPAVSDPDKAQRYCDELRTDFPGFHPALLLQSEIESRRGNIEAAISAIGEYLVHAPDDAKALYQRALHHLALGQSARAIADLEELKRGSPLALELRPRLLLARLRHSAGETEPALRELESLAADAPQSAQALEALVLAYLGNGRLTDAVRRLTTHINAAGASVEAQWFYHRAEAFAKLENFAEALADAKRGAEIAGHDAEGMMRVLDICLRAGWASDGTAYYESHAGSSSPGPVVHARFARLLVSAGRASDAVGPFRTAMAAAIEHSPDAVRGVSFELAAAFEGDEAAAHAIRQFEQSPPNGALGRANDWIRARLYRMTADTETAAGILTSLVDTTMEHRARALILHEIGDLRQRQGRAREARAAYEESLKYNGDHWITLNNLAFVLSEDFSEPAAGLPYAERAVAAMDTPDTRDTLGWIQFKLGRFSAAIASLSEAVRRGSTDPLHHFHLGEAFRRNGQHGAAGGVLKSGRRLAQDRSMHELVRRFDRAVERNDNRDAAM